MLCLTRKPGGSVIVVVPAGAVEGTRIEFHYLEPHPHKHQIRVGVTAPTDYVIFRDELEKEKP